MQYTLGQARKAIGSSVHAYGVNDAKAAINKAIQALSCMAPWDCLRKVIKFISAGPVFSLPQGSAGLVRACVNGTPATLRGPDFRFFHAGPGDLTRPPPGYRRVETRNILDLGWKPVMVEPTRPVQLFAFADSPNEPPITIRGLSPDGRIISTKIVPIKTDPEVGPVSTDVEAAPLDHQIFQIITDVVIDNNATAYVTLFAADAANHNTRFPIGLYHPGIAAPQFHYYEISGLPHAPIEVLAEVRVDPLPLVRDSDILPIPGIEPIEWMIRYDWCMKANEIDVAAKYQAQAAQWLKGQEVVEETFQTPLIANTVFDNSMGEISMEAFNI